jgi:hypothetical protein
LTPPPTCIYELRTHASGGFIDEFADRLKKNSEGIIRERIEYLSSKSGKEPSVPLEVAIQYAVASYTGIISWWFEKKLPYPPEEIARQYIQLNVAGLYGAIGLH